MGNPSAGHLAVSTSSSWLWPLAWLETHNVCVLPVGLRSHGHLLPISCLCWNLSLLGLPVYYCFVSSAGMDPKREISPFAFNLPRQLLVQHRAVHAAGLLFFVVFFFYQGCGNKGVGLISFKKVKVVRHQQSWPHGYAPNAFSQGPVLTRVLNLQFHALWSSWNA